ncbi:class I SAM-dependent methyltransferase [Aeromicrobium sp.]|uniref:class I SAM-dependent methyltransferase n=1 Tax=Aeromicrobium sp. TaxID=1871063 RepID=UPI0028B06823|nr:class I SAM-dependent methyltransferase [Aeromicrobium sp.]
MESSSVRWAYSRLAEPYIEMFATGEHEHVDDLELIRRHLTTRPGVVLDLGCGPGHLTRFLADGGATVRGFDVSPEFIDHARKAHAGIEFELGSITELPLPDASVSGALCWYSLIHFAPEAIDGALTEIRRVLEPGGRLVVGFFVGDALEPFEHQVVTAYRWPFDDLALRLKAAGLDETERLQRDQQDRRPHGALVARAV